jgi:hypothetical protein
VRQSFEYDHEAMQTMLNLNKRTRENPRTVNINCGFDVPAGLKKQIATSSLRGTAAAIKAKEGQNLASNLNCKERR